MKKTYEQTLEYVNSQRKTSTIREYYDLPHDVSQAATDALFQETGWTLEEFCREELQHVKNSIITKGLICPKCGVDRTKAARTWCQSAALTGECPMVGTAYSGVEE